ncbi:MAG: tetratricopeptide repeat protein [Melioribacteraceae bacterium]|nr:tetratricopeptide repeat protein [Melioribacteraceae bacterium]MCF8395504.1 tetratricopeptide repeat protein [Melioribacteraceae bacterium]MCF8420844.1 tetratricopeptide repeat protein [Melioribacteraceae bacterium]
MRKIFFLILIFCYTLTFAQTDNYKYLKIFNKSIEEEEIGNYTGAISELNEIYKEVPDDYLINLRLGWLYYQDKNYDESIKYYSKALEESDESIEAWLGLTFPYSGLEDWGTVKDIYQKILDKDELHYTANLRLGQILLNTGNYVNAKVYLQKLYELYPSDYEINLYLGWTYYYLGDKSKAQNHFTHALIASPDDSSAKEGLRVSR